MILIMHTRSGYLVINFKDDQKVIQQRSMGASSPSTAMHNHGNSPDENESTSIELSSNNFTFPSPETRVKYYMGDWYGRTVSNSDDVLCNEISAFNEVLSDQTVLWRERKMAEEIAANSSKKWLIRAYLVNVFDVINSKEKERKNSKDDDDRSYVLFLGDSHSHSTKLPVVAKTRFSRFAIEKSTNNPFFTPIIWPMEMHRHYFPVQQYLKLD